MRITIVQGAFLPIPPVLGGAVEKIWFALGKEFARRGHTVTHVSRRHTTLASEEFVDGVQHIRVPGFDTPSSLLRLKWRDFRYSRKVLKVLPDADVVVTNTFWMPVLSRNPNRGKIYVHVARYPKGQIRLYGNAARLQTVSHVIEEAICKEAPNLASRVRVIPYFVDGSSFQSCNSKPDTNVLYVGRIHPEKGIHLLVDAFHKLVASGLRDWRLCVVGPWEVKHGGGGEGYFNDLRKQSQNLGDRVEWKGPIFDAKELLSHYRQSPIFVYPSIAERGETFGLAPLEAMAAGCAPIVSSLECFQDFIKPGLNGWTFNHRSDDAVSDLAGVLEHALTDADALTQVRECAFRTAQQFTLAKVADRFLNDFEEAARQ